MTQTNIYIMDKIVDELANGKTLSQALQTVYIQRSVAIPFNEKAFDANIRILDLSVRSNNALLRNGLETIGDVVAFSINNKLTNLRNMGVTSAAEVFEKILDYCWSKLTKQEKVDFIIDTVERNEINMKPELF